MSSRDDEIIKVHVPFSVIDIASVKKDLRFSENPDGFKNEFVI